MKQVEPVTFGLLPGFGHGAWCWDYLRPRLTAYGHDSVAVELPIGDPDATFEDYATVTHDQLKYEDRLVLVGHSRSANVIPRAAAQLAVEGLVYLCGSFEEATLAAFEEPAEASALPAKYWPGYEAGLYEAGSGLWTVRSDVAKEAYYNKCAGPVKDWAASKLRPQRRSDDEPVMATVPDAPQLYVRCPDDRTLQPAWVDRITAECLQVEVHDMKHGDHSPFLSYPDELAATLVTALAKLGITYEEA